MSAIASNYRAIRAVIDPDAKVFACLKQDAYGCGAGKVASLLSAAGADAFGVVSIADALAVRKAAPGKPILMYPGIGPNAVDLARDLDLTISISGEEDLAGWLATGASLKVFVKVDLGFWRAGVAPSDLQRLIDLCASEGNVAVDGLYAHLNEFGDAGSSALAQVARLTPLLEELKAKGRLPATVMVSSSESLLHHPEFDMDAVDPGALLFGMTRSRTGSRTLPIRPALSAIKARIVASKRATTAWGRLRACRDTTRPCVWRCWGSVGGMGCRDTSVPRLRCSSSDGARPSCRPSISNIFASMSRIFPKRCSGTKRSCSALPARTASRCRNSPKPGTRTKRASPAACGRACDG
ncbi:alanine racemase [Mesorhizobium sp. M0060]